MKLFSQFAWGVAGVSVAIFFGVATWSLISFGRMAEEKIPQYEELWTRGWDDFNKISGSIEDLTNTTRPLIETFPKLVSQVDEMNDTIRHMDQSVQHLSITVPPQMGFMGQQMGRMQNNMTPGGMFRQMMPW